MNARPNRLVLGWTVATLLACNDDQIEMATRALAHTARDSHHHATDERPADAGYTEQPDVTVAALCELFEVTVDCTYDASAGSSVARLSGQLRALDSQQFYGALTLTTMEVGDPSSQLTRDIHVSGTPGQLEGTSVSGEYVFLQLSASPTGSSRVSTTSSQYFTDCRQTSFTIPEAAGSDLEITQSLILHPNPDGTTYTASFAIRNNGNEAVALHADTRIAGMRSGAREPVTWYPPSRVFHIDTQAPLTSIPAQGAVGVEIQVPGTAFDRCATVELTVDPEKVLQTGVLNPFANDTKIEDTPCLSWGTTLTAYALGTLDIYAAIPAGSVTTPKELEQLSLAWIVSSWASGRPDGKLCSECHFATSNKQFRPPTEKLGLAFPQLNPRTVYGATSWDDVHGGAGLALKFLAAPKPAYLKMIVERWIRDGMRWNEVDKVPGLRE